jgi:hypothetical protein
MRCDDAGHNRSFQRRKQNKEKKRVRPTCKVTPVCFQTFSPYIIRDRVVYFFRCLTILEIFFYEEVAASR